MDTKLVSIDTSLSELQANDNLLRIDALDKQIKR